MKLIEICLLKEGDIVYVGGRKKRVTKPAHSDTICVDGESKYFSELSKTKEKSKMESNIQFKGLMG
jgi:hypothetical protein